MDNSGFEKIDLGQTNKNSDSIQENNFPIADYPKKNKRSLKIVLVILFIFLIFSGFFLYVFIQARKIYTSGREVYSQAKVAMDAFKMQNVFLAKEELVKTSENLKKLKASFAPLEFLRFIPLLNSYYKDANHIVDATDYGLNSAIVAADSLIPYADVLGLKGEKSFVQGSSEERIKIAVKTMGKIVPKIDEIEGSLLKAKQEVDQINPSRYPNFRDIRAKIVQVKTIVDEGVQGIEEGKPLIKALPALLGEPDAKQYIVLFQNDKELRPTGGFITFYAIFRVEGGAIFVDSASDIYTLDQSIFSHPSAPDIILKYLPKVYTFNIRDSNLSPDFAKSVETFNSLYAKSSMKKKIDGVIALDTHVLVSTLEILGDITTSGMTFGPKQDSRCDCPQVVYELELLADKPVGHEREDRKAIIGDLLYAIMQKSLSSSPKLYWGRLLQQWFTEMQEKHILVNIFDKDAQAGLEALNLAGRIKDFNGDYLHVNDANFAGAKSNMYVSQSVRIDYDLGPNQEVIKTLTTLYKNPYPHSDCDLERGGLCLNATLRDFVRVYVPLGSVLLDARGSEVKVETKEDLGKTVFEGFLTVKPEGKSEFSYKYRLPFKLDKEKTLPVLIQKQPGKDAIFHEIFVNGKKIESFDLKTDKEVLLDLSK